MAAGERAACARFAPAPYAWLLLHSQACTQPVAATCRGSRPSMHCICTLPAASQPKSSYEPPANCIPCARSQQIAGGRCSSAQGTPARSHCCGAGAQQRIPCTRPGNRGVTHSVLILGLRSCSASAASALPAFGSTAIKLGAQRNSSNLRLAHCRTLKPQVAAAASHMAETALQHWALYCLLFNQEQRHELRSESLLVRSNCSVVSVCVTLLAAAAV